MPRLSIEEAEQFVFSRTMEITGRFYGAAGSDLALGAGLIYAGVRYPLYNPERNVFRTVAGIVLVLTHECDIEPSNDRTLNSDVLIVPLVPLREFVEKLIAAKSDDDARAYLGDLTSHRISQMMYLPPLHNHLPQGAVMYLNRITFTHLDAFGAQEVICVAALSGLGMTQIDFRLENHLRRPKADRLPLSDWT